MGDREAQCCGHQFQTVAQRRRHEQRVERGERVVCPCGDVCSEGDSGQYDGPSAPDSSTQPRRTP